MNIRGVTLKVIVRNATELSLQLFRRGASVTVCHWTSYFLVKYFIVLMLFFNVIFILYIINLCFT